MTPYYRIKAKIHGLRLMLFAISLLAVSSCQSPDANTNQNTDNSSRVAIPMSLQTLALPTDTTSFTAKLFLDGGTTPIATSLPIATDGTQPMVSFTNITVATGMHTFTIQFEVETTSYGLTVLATAPSDSINVTAGSSQVLNFDLGNYNFNYDDDNDLVTNIDELDAGTPPNSNVCYTGVSILGSCALGA